MSCNKRVYLGGHILSRGAAMQRAAEKEELLTANPGLAYYNPQDNKEINDKTALKDDTKLAERIVKHDTDAIMWSDTVVIEPLHEACGTLVELGQIKGLRDAADQVVRIIEDDEISDSEKLAILLDEMLKHKHRKVYPHFEDVRRVPGITEIGDRRSLGINQYIYGVCLNLTDGKGFYEWDEIVKELSDD